MQQVLKSPANSNLEATETAKEDSSSRSPSVLVDVHHGAENQAVVPSTTTTVRHVQTSESAAAAASALNDDEKENEEDVVTASFSTAATATGGVATVSFEMKPTNKPRKANSLRRSESGGGGVRPKEKLHGALQPL